MYVVFTSKEFTAFSDFPPPKEFPNFMYHWHLMEYYTSYMKNFELEKHIHYESEVTKLCKSADFDETGRWDIQTTTEGNVTHHTFDAVLVCTGHFADKNTPYFQGEETYTGKMMHSLDYRVPTGFEGKNVLTIGFGNSGADIAAELGPVAKQVFLQCYSYVC